MADYDFDERTIDLKTGQEPHETLSVYARRSGTANAEYPDGTMELDFVTAGGLHLGVCCVPYTEMLRLSHFILDAALEYDRQDMTNGELSVDDNTLEFK